MKSLTITYEGLEDSCSKEIKELLNISSEIRDSVAITDVKSEKDICLLTYKLQSARKVLQLLDSFEFKEISEIEKSISKIDLTPFLKDKISFVVRCLRFGDHDFQAGDVERSIGSVIFEKYKNKVDLENPDYIFYIYIHSNSVFFGIDYAGIDLSKREYKIFSHPSALRGPVAFLLLKLVGYDKTKLLLDPFCGSGTIPIEAALHSSGLSHNFYSKKKLAFTKFIDFDFESVDVNIDKKSKLTVQGFDHNLQSVSASNKNAKIAGIDKIINFSRVDIEWLDTKYEKESVDLIVTNPPMISKIHPSAMIEKIYKELFYQLEFVMKKSGVILFVSRKTDLLKKQAAIKDFKIKKELAILIGKETFRVLILSK
ncbi:MAG: THUMP domain-containing protein [Nanoarchaeota archaeon]|nr:THUMP domain-containing protein [Nanoarchaeota archaeon]